MKPVIKKSRMNKTEQLYASVLDLRQRAGEIIGYAFEGVKFRLADNTWYTPDFFVTHSDHFEIVEIKGFLRDDAAVKFKTVAELYHWFHWKMLRKKGQQWETIYEK